MSPFLVRLRSSSPKAFSSWLSWSWPQPSLTFFRAAQIENIQCQRQVLLPQGIQRGMEAAAVQQTRQIVSADMVLQRALPCLVGG